MRRLATWSGQRVLALWLAWFALLACVTALYVQSQRRSHAAVAIQPVPDPGSMSEQHTDLVFSVVGDPTVLRLEALLLLLGPPGFLTVLWLYARHRRRRMPPGV
jgi:hypothetical protein